MAVNPFRICVDSLAAERERWLLWAPVGVGLGIVLYFALPFEPSIGTLAAAPVLMLALVAARRVWVLYVTLGILLAFALGFNAAQIETRMDYAPMLDRTVGPVGVTGRLMHTEVMPDGVRLTLKDVDINRVPPEATPVKIRIKLKDKTAADIPPPGTLINLWAQVGPFSEPVMPGATDFRRQAYFRQLGAMGWSFSAIKIVDANPPVTSLRDKFSLMFEQARRTLAQHVYARLSGDVAAMTATRLNGEQTAISEPVIESMRIAGLAHLLSTSGFHVTIMALLVYFPLRALLALIPWIALRFNIKKWAAGAAIFSALGYTFLVGSQPATMRSMLMTGIAMIAIVADRRTNAMRLVMLSAALAMMLAPDALLGPSFQMSFAAVFCLIAAHGKAWEWTTGHFENFAPQWMQSFGKHMWGIARTSLIATAATTPFCVYHFQTFSFYGFIANMLAIPLTSFWVMPCILMAYITVPFGWDGWFIDGAGAGIWVTMKIAQHVASWPYSIVYLPAMPPFVLGLSVAGGLWLCLWQKRWRYLGLVPLVIALFYPLYTAQPDVMVTEDGKQWAARLEDGRLAVSNLDKDKFTVEQWQQRLGMVPTVDVFELAPTEKQLRCDDAGCVYHHGSHVLAMPVLESAALMDCEKVDTVIAPFVIRDCDADTVLDEPEFWWHGAHAIYFKGDHMRIADVRQRRGMRPWSEGWSKVNSGSDRFLKEPVAPMLTGVAPAEHDGM